MISQVAVLAPGFSVDDWPEQFGAIPATKSFEEWGEGKGVLIASWHRFKGLEADAIVIIETPGEGRCQGTRQSLRGAVAGEALAHV